MTVPDSLGIWAAKPGPAKLIDTVRLRARRGQRTEAGALTTLRLSAAERRDVALVLGTDWDVSGRPPRLQDLAERLAEHALTVRGFVEQLDGGLIEPDAELRRARDAAAAEEVERVVGVLANCGVNEASARVWLAGSGLPKPGTGDLADLVGQVASVWAELPVSGVRLAQLAATTRKDAHALDADRLLGRAVVRLIAVVHDLERPRRAGAAWRTAWAAAGVRCDGVSSRVLTLNLSLRGTAPAVAFSAAAPGEPTWLTLRSLAGSWHVRPTTVFVCENVTVIESAADALGAVCPAMVCTDGTASGAALDLLSGLAAGGCQIRYRADFDSAGFVIADQIVGVAPAAVPWRFDAPSYLAATGRDAPSSSLADARAVHGLHRVDVHEELLLEDLIADLAHAAAATGSL